MSGSLADLLAAATPGPWRIEGGMPIVGGPEGFSLLEVIDYDCNLAFTNEADGRLIALTPSLAAVAIAAEAWAALVHPDDLPEDELAAYRAVEAELAALREQLG